MSEKKDKLVKIGNLIKKENGKKSVKLGSEGGKDPKYDYTVLLKVLDSAGNEVAKVKNPWIQLFDAHERAPKTILNDLMIFVPVED